MINKERLEELKKENTFIFYILNNSVQVIKVNESYSISENDKINNGELTLFHNYKNVFQDICEMKKVFETQKQAEWYLTHHVTRIETLDLPTWEEFTSTDNSIIRFYVKERKYTMHIFVKNKKTNNCRILIRADDREQDWLVFEEPATEENYIEACKLCVKLFEGEK